LCVEIGETAGTPALGALRELGVAVAIDARSAIACATGAQPELAVDIVKLDRRFVGRMDEDPSARGIVDAVLGLARSLGAKVVAEGIEDDAQARALAELGCELGQGFAFAPASPATVVESLLAGEGESDADQIRVYLCDDAPALRHLLRSYLEWGGDVEVVGESADGEGLTDAVCDADAEVVLLDLSMPRVDGLEALADLRAAAPDLGIVVLSGFEEHRMAAKALALGADRYMEKASGMEEVRASVRAVAADRRGARALAGAA
jgi:CheY-like chemotaxis protein